MTRVGDIHRTAFVTGASTGLGRAFAEMLLREGVRVWGTSRQVSRLEPLAKEYPDRFTPVALELRDVGAVEAAFAAASSAAEGIDIVINNAGYGVFAEFAAVDFERWREQLEVMLLQPARLSHLALREMMNRHRGAIVNISSLAAEFPLPFQSAYNMAKAGMTALNESLIIETAGSGVVVLDFRPGDYRTSFDGAVLRPQSPEPPRLARAWQAFDRMMRTGPEPAHAADALRRALLRNQSGTVRSGRFFQAVVAPFLARFGSLPLRRQIQARYFDVHT